MLAYGGRTFRTVDVDGMYFIALRFRGISNSYLKVTWKAASTISRGRAICPLDRDRLGYAVGPLYLTGASFW